MINWKGWTGGAVAWLVFFVAILGERWIVEKGGMDIKTVIEQQESAIEWDRTMCRHYGAKYREQLANPDSDPEFQRYQLEDSERNVRERRERARALAVGLEIIKRRDQEYGACDHCGQMAYLLEVGEVFLCEGCDLELVARPETVTDADYPPVEERV